MTGTDAFHFISSIPSVLRPLSEASIDERMKLERSTPDIAQSGGPLVVVVGGGGEKKKSLSLVSSLNLVSCCFVG